MQGGFVTAGTWGCPVGKGGTWRIPPAWAAAAGSSNTVSEWLQRWRRAHRVTPQRNDTRLFFLEKKLRFLTVLGSSDYIVARHRWRAPM